MHYRERTRGTCSRSIDFDLEEGRVHNIRFFGGCDGNLKALSKVLEGWSVDDIEKALLGNTCGDKPTSCADQLAQAVRRAQQAETEN